MEMRIAKGFITFTSSCYELVLLKVSVGMYIVLLLNIQNLHRE